MTTHKLTSFLCILGFSLITFAQSNRDKIKTLKIGYITEKLNLSEQEAQKFWPIYNNFEDEKSTLRNESYKLRKKINLETTSEEDAKQILKEIHQSETKKQQLENDFIDRLIPVISAKKILLLREIEDNFKRKMFEEYKRRKP